MNVTAKLNEAAVNRAVLANLPAVLNELYCYTGRPTSNITDLNPSAPPKRLREFRIGDGNGAWRSHSTGDGGPDLTSFVMWFGSCERPAAVELLSRLVSRFERAAA